MSQQSTSDPAKCRACGHPLTVTSRVRCAECGLEHELCVQTQRDRAPARRLALLLALIALAQCIGFGLLGLRTGRQLDERLAAGNTVGVAAMAYSKLRQAVIDTPTAPKSLIAEQDKKLQAAVAAERAARIFPSDSPIPFLASGAAFAAFICAAVLFLVAWTRRLGEMTKADRRLRGALVTVWALLITGGWALQCVECAFILIKR
jgi:hypothetical protein